MCEVTNTVKFSFPIGSERPTYVEVANFVKALDADPAQMEASYRLPDEKALYIKFKCEEAMLHALTFNPEDLIFRYANGHPVQVRLSRAGDYVQYVRVFGLVPEIPDREVAAVLGKYGKVNRIIREKYPSECALDQYTGVRGAYMDVKKEIPSWLTFQNRKGQVSYDGNKDKCFICKMEGHRMNSCPKRTARKQPKKQQDTEEKKQDEKRNQDEKKHEQDEDRCDSPSYAGVVAGAVETVELTDEEVMTIDEMAPASENTEEEHASGSQEQQRPFDYRKNPTYLAAKEMWKQQQRKEEEKKNEERKKLKARKK